MDRSHAIWFSRMLPGWRNKIRALKHRFCHIQSRRKTTVTKLISDQASSTLKKKVASTNPTWYSRKMAVHTTSRQMISLLFLKSDHLKRLYLSLMSTNYAHLQRSDHLKLETVKQSRRKIAKHQSDLVSIIPWQDSSNNRQRINPNCQTHRDPRAHLPPSSRTKNIEVVHSQCYQLWLDKVTLRAKTLLAWKVQIDTSTNNRVIDHQCLRIPLVNLLEPIKNNYLWLCPLKN